MAKKDWFEHDQAWARELESGLMEYIDDLMFTIEDEEGGMATVTGEPFCGCDTCYWREILAYVTPKILRGQQEGKTKLIEIDED